MAKQLALVTGASSGIGLSLAKELASRGYDLVICSAGERLESAAQQLQSFGTGTEILKVQADLATREGVDELWEAIKSTGRHLDIACINAGVGLGGNFWDTDLEQELNMVELNCTGTVHLAKHVIRNRADGEDDIFPIHWCCCVPILVSD